MATDSIGPTDKDWRNGLPALTSRGLVLREPVDADAPALAELLSIGDATSFGLIGPVTASSTAALVARMRRDRAAGVAFSYAVTMGPEQALVGLVRVRQLDPAFEAAECEATLTPFVRGTGVFVETARLVGAFAFGEVGVYRLESRVLLQNGRANGALRKIGAVQEGVLRRSVRRQGEYLDQALWALVKDDWNDLWAARAPRVH